MTIAGIIGGIGPESTMDYYRSIIATYQQRKPDGTYPSIILNSIDLSQLIRMVEAGALEELADYVSREIQRLAAAGADFAALSANTPHIVFDKLRSRSEIPLISIVEAASEEAERLGLKKLGLLGTRFTMQGRFYPDVFSRRGLALVVPGPEDQADVHSRYMRELLKGRFLPETRDRLLQIIERLRRDEQIQGLILAGTELPLILRDAANPGIPFLDTTEIHVRAIVDRLL